MSCNRILLEGGEGAVLLLEGSGDFLLQEGSPPCPELTGSPGAPGIGAMTGERLLWCYVMRGRLRPAIYRRCVARGELPWRVRWG